MVSHCLERRLTSRGPKLGHHRQPPRTSLPLPITRPTLARPTRIRHLRFFRAGQARAKEQLEQANPHDLEYLRIGQHDSSEAGCLQRK
jgi:hypothetical protein